MSKFGHPTGITTLIVGIECGERGRSCEEHSVCGSVLHEDCVCRVRIISIELNGRTESALGVYWVSDGVDRCLVGFLQRHCLRNRDTYDGKLLQVIEMYNGNDSPTKRSMNHRNKGCCLAAIIDSVPLDEQGNTPSMFSVDTSPGNLSASPRNHSDSTGPLNKRKRESPARESPSLPVSELVQRYRSELPSLPSSPDASPSKSVVRTPPTRSSPRKKRT